MADRRCRSAARRSDWAGAVIGGSTSGSTGPARPMERSPWSSVPGWLITLWPMRLVPLLLMLPVAVACTSGLVENGATAPAPIDDEGTVAGGASESLSAESATAELGTAVRWSIDAALVAGSDCENPVVGEPFKIGYAADFSALGDEVDIPGSEAVQHLAKLVNCSGGVDGTPIEIRVVDISGSPLVGRGPVAELLDWGPQAIIGPRSAEPGLRLLQATGGRIPVVFAASTEPALADPSRGSFLVTADGAVTATAAARFALEQGWLTAATLTVPGPDFGADPAAFVEAFVAGGGLAVTDIAVLPDDLTAVASGSLSDTVAQLASGPAPDVIFTSMPVGPFAAFHRAAVDAGVDSAIMNGGAVALVGLPLVDADGPGVGVGINGLEGDIDRAAEARRVDLNGSYAIGQVSPDGDARATRLDDSFRAANGSASTNPTAAALAGDAVAVILEAYLSGGKGSPDATIRALSDGLAVEGVSGTLRYNGNGTPSRTLSVLRLVDGTVERVAVFEP